MKATRTVAAVLALSMLPLDLHPCAQVADPVFTVTEWPTSDVAGGEPFLVSAAWPVADLLAAYRRLEGLPTKAWAERERARKGAAPAAAAWGGQGDWDRAVERATGKAPGYIQPEREVKTADGSRDFYLNCLDDAFRTAARALDTRLARYGQGSREVTSWLEGQNLVFGNCRDGDDEPAELDGSWPAALRADRAYQRAAAAFYSRRHDVARERFRAIADDKASEWRGAALVSSARTFLRDGQWPEAEAALLSLRADASLGEWHASAQRLLAFIALRLRPARREAELAARLLGAADVAPDPQEIIDYAWLWHVVPESTDARSRDFRDWVASLQAAKDTDKARTAARWREKPTAARLAAALGFPIADAGLRDELLGAAAEVPAAAPAYLTVAYGRAARLLDAGRGDEAARVLDDVLGMPLSKSDENTFRRLRALLVPSTAEFLRLMLMPRVAESEGGEYAIEGIPSRLELPPEALAALNQGLPLARWSELLDAEGVPDAWRRAMAGTALVRAIVDGKPELARGFASALARVDPGLAGDVQPFLAAQDLDEASITASLLLLRHSDLHYTLRDTAQPWGEEWWCDRRLRSAAPIERTPRFLGENVAWGEPAPATSAITFLGERVLAYADKEPRDPRVPEALHRIVRVGAFGCDRGRPENGALSKRAFTRLHRSYPKSRWARQTPYWYR
jgi:hypothetical protein